MKSVRAGLVLLPPSLQHVISGGICPLPLNTAEPLLAGSPGLCFLEEVEEAS